MAATAADLELLIKKLRGPAKDRDAGFKLLRRYLEVEDFCSFLDDKTRNLGPGTPPATSWPGLLRLLCDSIRAYVERKNPSLETARLLRLFVQCGSKSGNLKLSMKSLCQHIIDILKHVPSYESEYGNILCTILPVSEYRMAISQKMYGEMLATLATTQNLVPALLSLIAYPPGDVLAEHRLVIVKALCQVFEYTGDAKRLKKAIESAVEFLRNDGPNLGNLLCQLHGSVERCIQRLWPTLQGGYVKDYCVLYLRMQVNLRTILDDYLEGLYEIVHKELDSSKSWDTTSVSRSLVSFMELAASVIYEVFKRENLLVHTVKRRKKDTLVAVVEERINDAKPLWLGSLSLLMRSHAARLPHEFLREMISSLVSSFGRLANEAINASTYEGPLWTLRCLADACEAAVPDVVAIWHDGVLWQSAWDVVSRRILALDVAPMLMEEGLKVLGCLAMKKLVSTASLPSDFWNSHMFKDAPSKNAVFLVAALFSSYGTQLEDVAARKLLLGWCLTSLNPESSRKRIPPKILSAACLAISIGSTGCGLGEAAESVCVWWETGEDPKIQDRGLDSLDMSEEHLAFVAATEVVWNSESLLSLAESSALLQLLAEDLLQSMKTRKRQPLEELFDFCAVVLYCLAGVTLSRRRASGWPTICEALLGLVQEEMEHDCNATSIPTDMVVGALHELVSAASHNSEAVALHGVLQIVVSSFRWLQLYKAVPPGANSQKSEGIIDDELDAGQQTRDETDSFRNCKAMLIAMSTCIGEVHPEPVWDVLKAMLQVEEDPRLRAKILLSLCSVFRPSTSLTELPTLLSTLTTLCAAYSQVLTASQILLSKLRSANAHHSEVSKLVEVIADASKAKLGWSDRCMLGECISSMILYDATLAEPLNDTFMNLLHDPDFRVRASQGRQIRILFEKWSNHRGLLDDIYVHMRVRVPVAMRFQVISAEQARISASEFGGTWTRSAIICLAEVAAASQQVESEAVFSILAQAAVEPSLRPLAIALLDKLSKLLGYPNRWQFLKQLLGSICAGWVIARVSLPALVEIKHILLPTSDMENFLQACAPFLLPYLLLEDKVAETDWLAKVKNTSVKDLVREYFPSIFAILSVLHRDGSAVHNSQADQDASFSPVCSVVQGSLLTTSGLTMNERNELLKKTMISVVTNILLLVSASDEPSPPYCTENVAVSSIKSVVDGLLEDSTSPPGAVLTDKVQIFRPDRLFQILLQIHNHASNAVHSRHRRHSLAKLETVVATIGCRIAVPGIFRYILHILLESLDNEELQLDCCRIISHLVETLEMSSPTGPAILGKHLQALVCKLVGCSIGSYSLCDDPELKEHVPPAAVMALLRRITVNAGSCLQPYIRELDPFPDIPCFENMRSFHLKLRSTSPFQAEFVKFVRRAPFLPFRERLWSLKSFCNKLREIKLNHGNSFSPDEVVIAVWELVQLCNEEDDDNIRCLTAEFLATVGIGDPDAVVFQLPSGSRTLPSRSRDIDLDPRSGISAGIVKAILSLLCNYLVDKDINVIEHASRAARGILATPQGSDIFATLEERDYLTVFPKVVNLELVNRTLRLNAQHISGQVLTVDDSSLWTTHGKSYESWIRALVCALIECCEDQVLRLCQNLASMRTALAEFLLPHVLAYLAGTITTTSKCYRDIVSQVETHIFCDSNESLRSIEVFLEAFSSLRSCYISARAEGLKGQGKDKRTQIHFSWPKVYWLDVDYILTARAAQKCAAYFTSVMYVEHWCEEMFGGVTLGEPDLHADEVPAHLELLLAVYTKIKEPDGVYGIVDARMPMSRVKIYEHERNWEKALVAYDLLLKCPSDTERRTSCYKGIVKGLHQVGCSQTNEILCIGLERTNAELLADLEFRELQYESAWRCGKWDFNIVERCSSMKSGYHEKLFRCFKYFEEGDSQRFRSHVREMRQEVVSHVVHSSLECTHNVHSAIVNLQVVDCLSQAWELRWPQSVHDPVVPSDEQMRKALLYYEEMSEQSKTNYELHEPFAAALNVLLRRLQRADFLPDQLLKQAVVARKAGQLNQAELAIRELKTLGGKDVVNQGQIEEAKVLWCQGQQEMAVKYVKSLLKQNEDPTNLKALYCLAGKWLAQTRAASSGTIMQDYFQKSVDVTGPASPRLVRQQSKAHFHLAQFANVLYQSYEDRLTSKDWSAALRLRLRKREEYNKLMAKLTGLKEGSAERVLLQQKAVELYKQLGMDAKEEKHMKDSQTQFLRVCLQNYRSCLLASDKYDIRVVFRLVSIWFKLSSNPDVVEDMLETATKVESWKFLPLVYQIASRMGSCKSKNDFTSVVCFLVKKMASEHPYHTLYQVFALANGDRIKANQKNRLGFVVDFEKKRAAQDILDELSSTQHAKLIGQVKQMVEVYINLAELELKEGAGARLPRDVRRTSELELVPVVTANIEVDRSCRYEKGFPYFKCFKNEITVMNGINAPKVVLCEGSDGRTYRQLAKSGDDDLRQDAVMEQLFGLVNILLKDAPETRKRRLHIRTYKVIPFTPSAGVLEWVQGTVPLGEYLLGRSGQEGAHTRYRPDDWQCSECRKRMSNPEADKRATFQQVCNNFKPVLRFFFLEKFKQAADWFQKRLAYTRSVATSSMVGYIIGLGDRHAMNILMDQQSAEVVHIDLGVAFEQGLSLRTPETIPFRLTRDIVDGMGMTGVEGVFRRCSEATLAVMRANKEALLTIIEVFIHDPLYRWALSPLKALRRQQEEDVEAGLQPDEQGNGDAARALMRVKQKLDGYEGGELRTVQGQVQQLIQDAQDPERLALLFPGWAAWL